VSVTAERRQLVPLVAVTCAAFLALGGCTINGYLTPQGAPYKVTAKNGSVLVTSTSKTGSNNREVTFQSADKLAVPDTAKPEICDTWENGSGIAQDGIAFDVAYSGPPTGGQVSSAIVLERNIFFDGWWGFVVIWFDPSLKYGFETLGHGTSLRSYLGTSKVFPLTICAQQQGSTIAFELAKGTHRPTLPLGNPAQGGIISISAAGQHAVPSSTESYGVYEAHVPPGTTMLMNNIKVNGVPYTP
jgi:hypothetical protein